MISTRSFALLAALLAASPAVALDKAQISRIDAETVALDWEDRDQVEIYLADTPDTALEDARLLAKGTGKSRLTVALPAAKRAYLRIRDHGDGSLTTLAERELPLEKGSNFRDLGGYVGAGGRAVRWGRIFRSGAMPLLSEQDYALLGSLGIGTLVDLRSTDEREVAPTALDDRTRALFVSNDYSLKPMMSRMGEGDGEYSYRGMATLLAPQYRAIFRRLLADEGALVYNCSAGQDRTGIATALVLTALGVDRKTILEDYHLSTALRRPQHEMPAINPADFPGNVIVQYYVAARAKPDGMKPEPLYSRKGVSHLVQFFELIEKDYGSVDTYLDKELGIKERDIAKLRLLYLQ